MTTANRATALKALSTALPPGEVERIARLTGESGQDLYAVVGRLGLIGQEAWAEAMAAAFSIPFILLKDYPDAPITDARISLDFQHTHKIVALGGEGGAPRFAVADPSSDHIRKALALALGHEPALAVATERDIEVALGVAGDLAGAGAEPIISTRSDEADVTALRDLAGEAGIVRFVNDLIARGARERASDIHIEPRETGARIRLRIDGVLAAAGEVRTDRLAAVTSRIKILSGLDIAERRMPQDGRFRMRIDGREMDIRVATGPSLHGETLVLRLLEQARQAPTFEELGMPKSSADQLRKILRAREGLVLATGPTGSGKTTTLYAALHSLNAGDRKIITVENPIEIEIDGAVQIEVKPEIGRTFSAVLRSILRHDPDIIMIGEMRDAETARIAVQAAMTGHLVLATLHTNDALGAVPRLIDFGIEPFLVSATLRGVLAQRLMRRLCETCRAAVPLDARSRDLFKRAGLKAPERIAEARGCDACAGAGYRGRIGIYEIFRPSAKALELIHARADATSLETEARAGGLRSLTLEALGEVAAGRTSLEEAYRVLSVSG